jgi:hypothetical protein
MKAHDYVQAANLLRVDRGLTHISIWPKAEDYAYLRTHTFKPLSSHDLARFRSYCSEFRDLLRVLKDHESLESLYIAIEVPFSEVMAFADYLACNETLTSLFVGSDVQLSTCAAKRNAALLRAASINQKLQNLSLIDAAVAHELSTDETNAMIRLFMNNVTLQTLQIRECGSSLNQHIKGCLSRALSKNWSMKVLRMTPEPLIHYKDLLMCFPNNRDTACIWQPIRALINQ